MLIDRIIYSKLLKENIEKLEESVKVYGLFIDFDDFKITNDIYSGLLKLGVSIGIFIHGGLNTDKVLFLHQADKEGILLSNLEKIVFIIVMNY